MITLPPYVPPAVGIVYRNVSSVNGLAAWTHHH
jgi:hypothetical protein